MSATAHLVEVIAAKVVDTLQRRDRGHCLQVAHLPYDVADAAAELVYSRLTAPDAVALVQTMPSKAWHAKPTKIVELRNVVAEKEGGRLAIFLEAGQHVAAEDSFGESTFEVLDLQSIHPEVIDHLVRQLQELHPDLSGLAAEVLKAARSDARFGVDDSRATSFLGRLVDEPNPEALGPVLAELGLLPDSQINALSGDELRVRLERNRTQMTILTDTLPPAERVRALPIDRSKPAGKRLASDILAELHDGTQDPVTLARRLGAPARAERVDFKNWQLGSAKAHMEELRVLQLIGDISDDPVPTVTKANASVGVKYRVRPAAGLVSGLKELNLELLRVGETVRDVAPAGKEASKRGKQLPQQNQAQWKLKLPSEPEEGTYVLRLRAYDDDNLLLREDVSDPFTIGDIDEDEPTAQPTPTLVAARVAAQVVVGADARVSWPPRLAAKAGADGAITARFDEVGNAWVLHTSPLLAQLERYSLDNPETLGWNVSLESIDSLNAAVSETDVPESFLDIRRQVFGELQARQLPVESERAVPASVSLADLQGMDDLIRLYARTWSDLVEGVRTTSEVRALLSVDQVSVLDAPAGTDARLVGPIHPLRLFWHLRYRETLDRWLSTISGVEGEVADLSRLLPSLLPANVPHVIPGLSGALRHFESLDAYWGLWAVATHADTGGLIAFARRSLGLDRAGVSGFRSDEVVRRIRRYLVAHPYANVLTLNFVQPGSARLVLDALLALQADATTQDLRYVVRLFSRGLARWEVGSALDEFMADPEASRVYKREAVDAFVASSDDLLAPKLTYSKHELDDLLHTPDRFPAHLTFFLDWFELDVVASPPLPARRSFFAEDLVVEPVVAFRPGGDERASPVWDQQVATSDAADDSFQRVFKQAERGVARLLGGDAPGLVPSVRLTLDRVRRSIFDAVHRNSDWVVTIDPVFTDDFLDTPARPGETSRYLIDYVEPALLETSRRIMVSTRSRSELARLFDPVAARYDLPVNELRIKSLLEALQVLGAGLPLKLLNNRTQALEALTLALGSLLLVDRGVFRHGFVMPLDSHQDLFREAVDWRAEAGTDLRRTDLAVVRPDPDRRLFGVHLVELKARASLGASLPGDLVEHIASQLENTHIVLRDRLFGADLRRRQGSLAAALQARRLMRMMTRYLERSARFGFVDDIEAQDIRRFLTTLDREYTISFDKTAVVFDLDGDSAPTAVVDGVQVMRIGRADIEDMLDRAPTRLATRPVPDGASELLEPAGLPSRRESVPPVHTGDTAAAPVTGEPDQPPPDASVQAEPAAENHVEDENDLGPSRDEVMLVGASARSDQFGIIGRQAGTGRPVAVDLDGTNVISVFGLQGAGKSYTVGTLLEAALIRDRHLNRLPSPLAGVVFHYSTDRRYVPEFASMGEANDDNEAVDALSRDYDTNPRAVTEVLVLVPPDVLEERQREFPDLQVKPLLVGPQELTVDDWRLLMGLEGGEQMYARAMNTIFRQLRGGVTIESLKAAIDASRMNQAQKDLASMRVEFVEAFVEDGAEVTRYVKPGRLLIVDLRDPYTEEDQALALFMVLLGRFGEVEDPATGRFNKLIVFDEAHKYMHNERLTTAIVESGRLMRHTGTSIVMASQDPPSVPKKVIELSTLIVGHRMTSPQWLEHLRKANEAFDTRSMNVSMLAQLAAGEAFVWARDGDSEFRRPQRVRMRPRLTRHGGATRRATT